MKLQWRDFLHLYISIPLLAIALLMPSNVTGLAVAAIFALYAFAFPKNGLLLLLLYFPTRPFLIEMNPSLKIVGDLIILAAFARVIFTHLKNKEIKEIFRFHIFEWAFLLFCAVGALSAFITGVSISAIVFQLRAFVITYLIYYVVKRLDITKKDIGKFLWTTFIVAITICIHGIVEKLSIRTVLMPEKWVQRSLSHNNRVRIYGLIDNPNVLAVYLTIAFVCTLYLKQFIVGKMNWLINIGLVLMFGVITLTYSRGTWIGFAVGLVVYILLTRNWKNLKRIALAVITAVIFINLPVATLASHLATTIKTPSPNYTDENTPNKDGTDRIKDTFNEDTLELSKTTGRLFIVSKGFEIFKDHPVIGTGFATYGDSAAKGYSSPIYKEYGIEHDIYSDNQYIQIIVQTGAIGVLLFAVFLLGMLFFAWKKREDNPIAILVVSLLAGVFVCGVLYNIWEDKTYTMYFFLLLAAITKVVDLKRTNTI
ncbi:O-antigen ligase family protein [Ferdinandcohnia quinoae]|uniref:O-antigen ligase family protein n=1 Tax=Fredinandcohnia quinoae TaxID=2918902 RepID=A0AAW5E2W0_9BACI|nr:O-antigen ligase family protein [Fredinandcohnia sp. SECRCQ15]MCH1625114.1 O-antigen ligase family protein [Fredinandcohnia sp. SECRCQ15]